MNMYKFLRIFSFVLIIFFIHAAAVCVLAQVQQETKAEKRITELLNSWHRAAAKADFPKYFSYMADDAILMGTDESEYWNKEGFISFSKLYFSRGKAWNFITVSRNIYLSENNLTA